MAGCHGGWPGPSLRKILSDEYPFDVTSEEASYIAIIGPVGDVIGGVLGSTLIDIIGRKWTILSIFIPQCLSHITLYFSYYYKELLYCGRIFGGIGEGATLSVVPVFVAEVAEPKVRGMLGTIFTMAFLCGKLFENVLGSYLDIHNMSLVCLIFAVLFVISFITMPETPYYLLMKGKESKAEDTLKYLRRKADVSKEIIKLTADVRRQMSESGKYQDLFRIKSNRRAFLIIFGLRVVQQFTGCSAFSTYIQILLAEGTNLSPVLGSSLVIICQLVVNILSTFLVDRSGRKPMFVISISTCFVVLLSLGTFFALRDYVGLDMSSIAWLPLLFMLLFIMGFQLGLGACMNIFISEMYSSSIKSKALSLGSIIFSSSMISSIKFYQITADMFGLAVPFYSFAVISGFGILFVIFVLPETKGKSLEQIQQELKGNKYEDRKLSIPDY